MAHGCSAVSAFACPCEEQVLDFTPSPWQGPPRSFFYCVKFPGSGRSAPASRGSRDGASRSNSCLRNGPSQVLLSTGDSLVRSSTCTWRCAPSGAVCSSLADRRRSIRSVPFPLPAIPPVAKFLCAADLHARIRGTAVQAAEKLSVLR